MSQVAAGSGRSPATAASSPSEQAALKVLYLVVGNLEQYRSPSTGIRSSGWKQALQAFTIYFDGRIPTPWSPRSFTQTIGRSPIGRSHRVRLVVVFGRLSWLAGSRFAGWSSRSASLCSLPLKADRGHAGRRVQDAQLAGPG